MEVNHRKRLSFWARVQQGVEAHKVLTTVVLAVIIGLAVWATMSTGTSVSRSESYKKVNGAAGLDAVIDYDCKSPCKQKYDFNVYIFYSDGQQMNVVRPDKDGHVRLATAGGNYVMLIGKPMGKDGKFPQESITLKNGQQLTLQLHYKETL
jgi:hypothetical protein